MASLTCPEDVALLPSVPARFVFDRLLRARLATTTRPGMVVVPLVDYVGGLARARLEATQANLNVAPLYIALGWVVLRTESAYVLTTRPSNAMPEYETEGLATPDLVTDVPRMALFIFDTILRQVLAEATPEVDWHFVSLQRYKSALCVALGPTRSQHLDARWFQVDRVYTSTGLWSVRTVTDGPADEQGYYFRPAGDEADGSGDGDDAMDPVLPLQGYALPAHVLRSVEAFVYECAKAGELPVLSAHVLRAILDAPRMSTRTANRILDAVLAEYKLFWDYALDTSDAEGDGNVLRLLIPPRKAPEEKRPITPLLLEQHQGCAHTPALILDAIEEGDAAEQAVQHLDADGRPAGTPTDPATPDDALADDLPALA